MIDTPMRGSRPRSGRAFALRLLAPLVISVLVPATARADKIKHPVAIFSGLDKITGRIIAFEVAADETVQFGSLQITERACYTRQATETPQTTTFIEVDELDSANDYKRIFSGWMYAASPGLHGIEHPIYDIWLTGCKGGTEAIAVAPVEAEPEPAPPGTAKPQEKKPSPQRRTAPGGDPAAEPPMTAGVPRPNRGPTEVGPPPGFIPNVPRERRAPVQRYYPTQPVPPRDPAGGF